MTTGNKKTWELDSNEWDLRKETGRISNALSLNIAKPKQANLFSLLSEENKDAITASDEKHYIDRRGKNIALSVEDIQIIKALSSYLPFNNPETKEYIEALNTPDARGKTAMQIPVSLLQLSKDIIGDTKETSLKKIAERIERLEAIQQVQEFNVNGDKYSVVRPLILLNEKVYKHYSEIRSTRGRKKSQEPNEKERKILVGANIIYSSLFLYEATNKYCPLYSQRLFEVWRRNKTEIFAILLSDLESKWRQYYINALKEEKKAIEAHKDLLATNKGEYYKLVAEARNKALIYQSSTITIRDRVTTDYETNRMQRSRFIPDLQRAINSLIEYGIITDRSYITTSREKVIFAYNPNFSAKELEGYLPPSEPTASK